MTPNSQSEGSNQFPNCVSVKRPHSAPLPPQISGHHCQKSKEHSALNKVIQPTTWQNTEGQSQGNMLPSRIATIPSAPEANKNNLFSWVDNSVTKTLSENLAELNLHDDRPKPTKIRRRNALTILDQHFPNPNSMQNNSNPLVEASNPAYDAFESASLLQSLHDRQSQQNGDICSTVEWQHPKRKVPSALYSSGSTRSSIHKKKMQQRHQKKHQEHLDKSRQVEISYISLHEDLSNFKPKGHDILPDKIYQELKQNQGNPTFPKLNASNNTCNALVLYRSPESLLSGITRRSSLTGDKKDPKLNREERNSKNPPVEVDYSTSEPCIEVEMS